MGEEPNGGLDPATPKIMTKSRWLHRLSHPAAPHSTNFDPSPSPFPPSSALPCQEIQAGREKPACQEEPWAGWLGAQARTELTQQGSEPAQPLESETVCPGADVQVTTQTFGPALGGMPGWLIPAAMTGRWEGQEGKSLCKQ